MFRRYLFVCLLFLGLAACASRHHPSQYQDANMTSSMQTPAGYVKPSRDYYAIPSLKINQKINQNPNLMPLGVRASKV